MGWKNIYIKEKASIRISQNRLHIRNDDKEVFVPIEDISSVVLGSRQINLSVEVLGKLGSHGVSITVTDDKHLPSSVLIPYGSYHRMLQVTELQLAMSLPFKKSIWKKIVRQKIQNQGHHLKLVGSKVSLKDLESAVKSGDPENREAQAASRYWEVILESGRNSDSVQNSGLNYTYSIVRSTLARSIASFGLLGHLGVHHKGPYNSFNLADDLIEPFRPIVDRFVLCNWVPRDTKDLLSDDKAFLQKILVTQVAFQDELHSVNTFCEKTVSSFVQSIKERKATLLELPGLSNG